MTHKDDQAPISCHSDFTKTREHVKDIEALGRVILADALKNDKAFGFDNELVEDRDGKLSTPNSIAATRLAGPQKPRTR